VSGIILNCTELPGDLARLQYLFLSDNPNLKPAPLPQFLWQLPNLESLSMRNSARTGTLPDSLGNLSRLRLLDLERNDLNGTLPEAMVNMSSLTYVFLNRNKFSGEIPASFGNLTDMVVLNLDHNQLTGVVPDPVCQLDVEVFTTDCGIPGDAAEPAIDCPCCTKCCLADAATCNNRDWSLQYGEDWGTKFYERYNVVEDDDVFELIVRPTKGGDS
jgi:Leucine rich repeat